MMFPTYRKLCVGGDTHRRGTGTVVADLPAYRILVVGRESVLARVLVHESAAQPWTAHLADSGTEGIVDALASGYDAIVFGEHVPGRDALDLLREASDSGVTIPIIIVGGPCSSEHRVEVLRAGADDFLAESVPVEEMFARIEAVLRRRKPIASASQHTLRVGTLELDLVERRASYAGLDVLLTSTECRLLALMMRNPGVVMTRTIIFERVWGYRFDPGSNRVDVYIGHLRKRLAAIGAAKNWLKTVRGAGYALGG